MNKIDYDNESRNEINCRLCLWLFCYLWLCSWRFVYHLPWERTACRRMSTTMCNRAYWRIPETPTMISKVSYLHTTEVFCIDTLKTGNWHNADFVDTVVMTSSGVTSADKVGIIRALYYRDITMSAMASQITGKSTICSTICSSAHQSK